MKKSGTYNEPSEDYFCISVVVNFEEGAELSILNGDSENNASYDGIDNIPGEDLCLQSHYNYTINTGMERLMNVLDEFNIFATISSCGLAVEKYPDMVNNCFVKGHEISGHGWRWESHSNMDYNTELTKVARTKDAIFNAIGSYPLGWHTRSSSSTNTRRILMNSGFLYDSDDYSSEIPYRIQAPVKFVVIPYSFECNDMQFKAGIFSSGKSFSEYIIPAIKYLRDEANSKRQRRLLTIGLHPRIISRPGRIYGLVEILSYINNNNIKTARRVDIASELLAELNEGEG
ncbi:polysaccharide deacetylase family protein [Acidithiobacillus sp. IBUN Pt1247-S3]|uniref:polysaccharide deacetylase family protein n=1 Tax=Acidithiobacillus sp. IBUN Pt1247-S3 TaxID=3166642 RepID=UPI0034E3E20A